MLTAEAQWKIAKFEGPERTVQLLNAVDEEQATNARRSRGRPRLEDVADIERQLLDVALHEFLRSGYGGTSMATIVKTAGVSKTTLYSRFPSKKKLFVTVMERAVDSQLFHKLYRLEDPALSLEDGLKAYASKGIELSSTEVVRGVDRLTYAESFRFPELGRAALARTESTIADVADFIARCAKRDGIPCNDPHAPAEIFILMLRGFHLNVMLSNIIVPPEVRGAWVERTVNALTKSRENW